MKRSAVLLSCLLGSLFCTGTVGGEVAVSQRPEVQKNFQQLKESGSCRGCDLAGAVLNRFDFSGADLEGANLAGAQLYMATLAKANLKNANLQGAALGGADLAGADLTGANLTGAILEGAYLAGALMDGKVEVQRPYVAEGGPESGEMVFVDNVAKSKKLPFTGDTVTAAQSGTKDAAPAVAQDQKMEKTAAEQAAAEKAAAEKTAAEQDAAERAAAEKVAAEKAAAEKAAAEKVAAEKAAAEKA
jgi:uncharacterized protein YjbI with pentapeptide repeats